MKEKEKKEKRSFKQWIKDEIHETKVLFKGLPAIPFTMVVLSFILMNLLATVPLFNESWIAGDCGIIVSWLAFLFGDMLVKRYGAKGSIKISIAALLIALMVMALLATGSAIEKGLFGANYSLGLFSWEFSLTNGMVTLWTLGASATAFIVSIVFNSLISNKILTAFKKRTSFKAYATAAYVSTFAGQFVDNIVFAFLFTFIASRIPEMQTAWSLQPVTVLAVIVCGLTGAVLELLLEVIFSPIGFKVAEKWRKEGVGAEYIALVPEAQEVNTNVDCITDIAA
jgi:uncharacterized PurR-regulated membrane protein YhhQ (DUF165 family)